MDHDASRLVSSHLYTDLKGAFMNFYTWVSHSRTCPSHSTWHKCKKQINHPSIFKASTYIATINILLIKQVAWASPEINGKGMYIPPTLQGSISNVTLQRAWMYNPIVTGRGWGLIIKSATGDHFPWGGSGEYDPHTMECWHICFSWPWHTGKSGPPLPLIIVFLVSIIYLDKNVEISKLLPNKLNGDFCFTTCRVDFIYMDPSTLSYFQHLSFSPRKLGICISKN